MKLGGMLVVCLLAGCGSGGGGGDDDEGDARPADASQALVDGSGSTIDAGVIDAAGSDAAPLFLVEGQVIGLDDTPREGVLLGIDGIGTTTTDASGHYAFMAPMPYTLIIKDPPRFDNAIRVRIFDQLTSTFLTVRYFDPQPAQPPLAFMANLPITFVPDQAPVAVGVDGGRLLTTAGGTINSDTLELGWNGGPTTTAHLHGLDWEEDPLTRQPSLFTGCAEVDVPVTAGVTPDPLPFALEPCASAPITIAYDVSALPAEFDTSWDLQWIYDDSTWVAWSTGRAPGSMALPLIDDGSASIHFSSRRLEPPITAQAQAFVYGAHGGDSVNVDFVALPAPLSPAGEDLDGVSGLQLAWSSPSRSTTVLGFEVSRFTLETLLVASISTSRSPFTMSDLTPYGYIQPFGDFSYSYGVNTSSLEITSEDYAGAHPVRFYERDHVEEGAYVSGHLRHQ